MTTGITILTYTMPTNIDIRDIPNCIIIAMNTILRAGGNRTRLTSIMNLPVLNGITGMTMIGLGKTYTILGILKNESTCRLRTTHSES